MSFSTTLTEILVYILPQQTYQQITKTIHTFFVYIYTFIIEPSAIRSIKLGLTFGIILASLLDFFPGEFNSCKSCIWKLFFKVIYMYRSVF